MDLRTTTLRHAIPHDEFDRMENDGHPKKKTVVASILSTMSTDKQTTAHKLNDLLEKTYDAEKGYKKAAENTDGSALKAYFIKKAQERYDFGHQLKAEIKAFGENVDGGDSLTGKARRTWMDIKAMFTSNNDEAMLEEAIRGEKASVTDYKKVLDGRAMPLSTTALLKSQKESIENGLSAIRTLEDLH